jgi:hypothetical protein
VHLHVSPIAWPTASLAAPNFVEVFMEGPRINAAAKDSRWLRDRYRCTRFVGLLNLAA